ncbi:MAG: hypothetical protein EOM20_10495 [Spartobacteria bacterium]|nr:hypothetical protein [Spartobacteria bacterium]
MPNPTRETLNAEIAQLSAQEQQTRPDGVQPPVSPDTLVTEKTGWIKPEPIELEGGGSKEETKESPSQSKLLAPDQEKDQSAAYWKDRAGTLHGMLIKERETLQADMQQKDMLIENMQARITLLESQKTTAISSAEKSTQVDEKEYTSDDITDDEVKKVYTSQVIEDYGMELLKTQIALRKNDRREILLDLNREREEQERIAAQQTEEQRAEQSRREQLADSFWRNCELILPNAREINTQAGWAQYLDAVDPRYQVPRRQILAGASPQTLCAAMSDYLQHAAGAAAQNNDIGMQLMPVGAAGGGGGVDAQTRPSYKMSQINAFYDDRTRGRYTGTIEQAKQIERQIQAALAEGRVIHDVPMK